MKLDQIVVEIKRLLLVAGIIEAEIESELLISNALGLSKEKYYAELNTDIGENDINNIISEVNYLNKKKGALNK